MEPMLAISNAEISYRIGMAMLVGLTLGMEREEHGRAAGLKTTMLACVSAAIAMILSEHIFIQTAGSGGWRPDPGRLAQGILTGMGFLGAGAIIRQGSIIRGVTTAAVIWHVTILGLTLGSGHYFLGVLGWVIALGALWALPHVEEKIKQDWYGIVIISMHLDGLSDEEIKKKVEEGGVKVLRMDMEYNLLLKQRTLRCELKMKKSNVFEFSQRVVKQLLTIPGIKQVKWN